MLIINFLVFYSEIGNKLHMLYRKHTFSTVISDISEGYLNDLHTSQQSSSFSVPILPEYVQNIITTQANQQAQSSQFRFPQHQQFLQPQQPQQQFLQPQQQVLQPQQQQRQ